MSSNKQVSSQALLKEKEYLNAGEIERRKRLAYEILNKNLTDLKLLCDQENVLMIIENYPHLNPGFEQVNKTLQEISAKLKAVYTDHYGYFKEKIGYEEWNKVMTSHVNYKGHEYMAQNLANVLNNIIKKLML